MSHVIGERDHDHRHYSALLKVGRIKLKENGMLVHVVSERLLHPKPLKLQ